MSTYCKEFLAFYLALEYSHFIWGAEKPVIVLTDNKSLTCFPSQNHCIHHYGTSWIVIAYNVVLAHIPGRANAAADFLLRMQTDPIQSLELQLLDSIPMKQDDIDMKAKTPDASLLSLESSSILNETKHLPIPQNLIAQLQANDVLQNLIPDLNEILASALP